MILFEKDRFTIDFGYTAAEIEQAYRKLCQTYRADNGVGQYATADNVWREQQKAAARHCRIAAAYDTLRDPLRKAVYDRCGAVAAISASHIRLVGDHAYVIPKAYMTHAFCACLVM